MWALLEVGFMQGPRRRTRILSILIRPSRLHGSLPTAADDDAGRRPPRPLPTAASIRRFPQPSSRSNRSGQGADPRPSPQQQSAAPSNLTAASSSSRASIRLTVQDQEMRQVKYVNVDHIHFVLERKSSVRYPEIH